MSAGLRQSLAARMHIVRPGQQQGEGADSGRYVLYWMGAAVRVHENPALDVAGETRCICLSLIPALLLLCGTNVHMQATSGYTFKQSMAGGLLPFSSMPSSAPALIYGASTRPRRACCTHYRAGLGALLTAIALPGQPCAAPWPAMQSRRAALKPARSVVQCMRPSSLACRWWSPASCWPATPTPRRGDSSSYWRGCERCKLSCATW